MRLKKIRGFSSVFATESLLIASHNIRVNNTQRKKTILYVYVYISIKRTSPRLFGHNVMHVRTHTYIIYYDGTSEARQRRGCRTRDAKNAKKIKNKNTEKKKETFACNYVQVS